MDTALKFPKTYQELAEFGTELVYFPGTWEEYWNMLEAVEFPIEFQDNEIIAMSYESDPHSRIVSTLQHLLNRVFDLDHYTVHASNRPVFIKSCNRVYHPDGFVIKEPKQLFTYAPGLDAETNPILVIEVLSTSTRDHDLEDKLPCYKQIPSLQQILYLEQHFPFALLFERESPEQEWSSAILDSLTSTFLLGGQAVALRDVYRKVLPFAKPAQ